MIKLTPTRYCPLQQRLQTQITPFLYGVYKPNTNALQSILLGTCHALAPHLSFANAAHIFSPQSQTQKHFAKADRVILEVNNYFDVYTEETLAEAIDTHQSIDLRLALEANMQGKKILGFDSFENLTATMKKAQMVWQAKSGIVFTPQELRENSTVYGQKLLEAFTRGDEKTLDKISAAALEMTGSDPEIILYRPNEQMAQILNSFWREKEEGLDFVAVGAAHLVGMQGVCSHLQDYEWTIKRLL